MRFTQWILALEDEDGVLDRFQKVAYTDINNGCASSKFDATDWKKHFDVKHKESATELTALLKIAYELYILRESAK